jgi:peptidyl-prolyl cis-trans isomerase D
MATLEKIRSKSVFLFLIIIIALLAFILGDFLTSGRTYFGVGDTVAKANGAKVNYDSYSQIRNQYDQANRNSDQGYNSDEVEQNIINDLLVEALMNEEYDRLGIKVTDDQLSELMLGDKYAMQSFYALMGQLQQAGVDPRAVMQAGIQDSKTFFQAMNDPQKYGLDGQIASVLKDTWAATEKAVDKDLRSQAYMSLIAGLFTANRLDAKAIYDEQKTQTSYAYVAKDLSSVKDEEVQVTDADIQKVYDEHRGAFRLTEDAAEISYIKVDIAPSDADYAAGDKVVQEMVAELKATPGTEAANKNSDFVVNTAKYTSDNLKANRQFTNLTLRGDSALTVCNVELLGGMNGDYSFAKILDVTTASDKVKFSAFALPAAQMDSVMANVTTATFDSIARLNGMQQPYELSLVNPQMTLAENQMKLLAENPVNQIYFVNDTVTGQDNKQQVVKYAFLINERQEPGRVYEIATIDYQVVPSAETINNLKEKFNAFVVNNNTAELFNKSAAEAGYNVNRTIVSASNPIGPQAPSSRAAVKWAMENGKGKVSTIYSFNNVNKAHGTREYLLAVAVEDKYTGDYIPATSTVLKNGLNTYALRDKKAQKIVDQYKGKSTLEQYAQAMGTEVREGQASFGQWSDSYLLANLATAKKGQVVGPFKGSNAVYVIQVKGEQQVGRPFNYAESAQQFTDRAMGSFFTTQQNPQTRQTVITGPSLKLLLGDHKIQNNILEFTQDNNK